MSKTIIVLACLLAIGFSMRTAHLQTDPAPATTAEVGPQPSFE